jgi:hypothetical protein
MGIPSASEDLKLFFLNWPAFNKPPVKSMSIPKAFIGKFVVERSENLEEMMKARGEVNLIWTFDYTLRRTAGCAENGG